MQNREKRRGAKKREMEWELSSRGGFVSGVLSGGRRSAWLGYGGAVSAERVRSEGIGGSRAAWRAGRARLGRTVCGGRSAEQMEKGDGECREDSRASGKGKEAEHGRREVVARAQWK